MSKGYLWVSLFLSIAMVYATTKENIYVLIVAATFYIGNEISEGR